MDFYDSDDNPIYYENLNIEWEIESSQSIIVFRSTDTTTIDALPETIDSVYMVYYTTSNSITSVNTELIINDIFLLALEAKILSRMYAKYSSLATTRGELGATFSKDWKSVQYWNVEFQRKLKQAIRERNEGKDERSPILYEDYSGGYIESKKTKNYDSAIGVLYPLMPIVGESLGGTKNGVNLTFTFEYLPFEDSEVIFLNGIVIRRDTDYTISGLTLTYIPSTYVPVPTTNDTLTTNYFTRAS